MKQEQIKYCYQEHVLSLTFLSSSPWKNVFIITRINFIVSLIRDV